MYFLSLSPPYRPNSSPFYIIPSGFQYRQYIMENTTFLHVGDMISLYTEGTGQNGVSGFLSTLG